MHKVGRKQTEALRQMAPPTAICRNPPMNVLPLLNLVGREPFDDTVRALISPWLFGLTDAWRPAETNVTDPAEESPARDPDQPHELAS